MKQKTEMYLAIILMVVLGMVIALLNILIFNKYDHDGILLITVLTSQLLGLTMGMLVGGVINEISQENNNKRK